MSSFSSTTPGNKLNTSCQDFDCTDPLIAPTIFRYKANWFVGPGHPIHIYSKMPEVKVPLAGVMIYSAKMTCLFWCISLTCNANHCPHS